MSVFSASRYILVLILSLIFIQFLLIFPKSVNNFSSVSALRDFSAKAEAERADSASANTFFNANQSRKSVEQTLRGLHLVENINEKKGWELRATEAIGSEQDQWTVKKVNITFFADEVPTFKVAGEVGEVNGSSKDLVIRGNVVTESSNGYTFATTELKYVAAIDSLVSQDSVTMKGPRENKSLNINLKGFGLRIHLPTNKMYILDQVESENLINGKMFYIQSKEAEFSNKSQEALFQKNVRMKFEDYKTTSEKALFSMSANGNQVEEVILSPYVEMIGTDKKGVCRQLNIDILADKITLKGSPRLTFNQDVISGEEIVLTEKGQKVKINRAQLSGSNSLGK
jgi:LPS export ABC transporter protein LptC